MNQEEADTGHYLKCANPRISSSRQICSRYARSGDFWSHIFQARWSSRDSARGTHGFTLGPPRERNLHPARGTRRLNGNLKDGPALKSVHGVNQRICLVFLEKRSTITSSLSPSSRILFKISWHNCKRSEDRSFTWSIWTFL